MNTQHKDFVKIDVIKVLPSPTGCAICLGNDTKVFVIYVGPNEGAAILMTLEGVAKSRPLTHDLIKSIFQGFNISIEYVLINDLKENTYYARLILKEENSLGKNIIEVDARPSDCIAIAKQNNAPIYIKKDIFEKVENLSHILHKEPTNEYEDEEEPPEDFNFFDDEEK
ncbi:MAG: hypothetical protein ACD_79C00410G0001 [uncultured bacterium]|nr:MAG: hypothetical protein ACD_79C00410G0001 [uncultured bacterium]